MLRLITDKQLRQKLGGCSEMTIWRLRRDGKLPQPKKLGNRNVTPETEADEAIAKLLGLPHEARVIRERGECSRQPVNDSVSSDVAMGMTAFQRQPMD